MKVGSHCARREFELSVPIFFEIIEWDANKDTVSIDIRHNRDTTTSRNPPKFLKFCDTSVRKSAWGSFFSTLYIILMCMWGEEEN